MVGALLLFLFLVFLGVPILCLRLSFLAGHCFGFAGQKLGLGQLLLLGFGGA